MINVDCPNCKEHYVLNDEWYGMKVQCTGCGCKFYIGIEKPKEKTLIPVEMQEKSFRINTNGKKLTDCPDCGETISRSAKVCPHCGKSIMSLFQKICYYILCYVALSFFASSIVSWIFFPSYAMNLALWAIFCLIAAKR